MTKRLFLAFLLLALAVASAKTYTLTLSQPAVVAGTELQPGDYKLSVANDNKVVITSRTNSVESPVKVEQSESKYVSTSVRLDTASGKAKVQEIHLGGTKMRLVFN